MKAAKVRIAIWTVLLAVGIVYLFPRVYPRRALVGALDASTAHALGLLEPTWDGADVGRARLEIRLVPVVSGLTQPTDLQFLPDRSDVAVVLEKEGHARVVDLPAGRTTSWFDIEVESRSELGLLGLAFHPKFAENGRFFVYSSPKDPPLRTRVEAWTSTPGGPLERASPRFERVVLDIAQPYSNHDGGQLIFGPDGLLYVAVGDGGSRDDPHDHGQDPHTWLGSVLRIDVEGLPYAVPPDNPYAGRPELGLPEIFAIGLRNPWRMSFAPDGRLVAGDVGQDAWEEVTFVPRGGNLGWRRKEGTACTLAPECGSEPGCACDSPGWTDPIWVYPHSEGVSVTGGVVGARGGLAGRYVFGDFGSGRLWSLELPSSGPAPAVTALGRWPIAPSAFARDAAGDVFVVCYRTGAVYRLEAVSAGEGA